MNKKRLFILLYFASPLLPICAMYLANPGKYTYINNTLSMVLGAIAYTWLAAQFVLSARPKSIETQFGMDRLYRFHGVMGVITLLSVFIHRTLMSPMASMLSAKVGNSAWMVYATVVILALLFMSGKKLLKVKTNYQTQILLHNLSFLGLLAMFVHVQMTYAAQSNLGVRLVFAAYFVTAIANYVYHKVIRRKGLEKNVYQVEAVEQVGKGMWSLHLRATVGNKLTYRPGQFAFIRVNSRAVTQEEHPFSFSSSPTDNDITFTIKELGDYTSRVKAIVPGDEVTIDGPYGTFSYIDTDGHVTDDVVFVVGGIGITPAMSMLKHMEALHPSQNVILIWGVNTISDAIWQDEILEMERRMPNFQQVPVVLKDDGWQGEKGLIDGEKIISIIENRGQSPSTKTFFICGPQPMMDIVIPGLMKLNVDKKRIRYERFSL